MESAIVIFFCFRTFHVDGQYSLSQERHKSLLLLRARVQRESCE